MIYPLKDQYINDAKTFNIIPVFKEIGADFETPLSIFLKVNAKFLLESVEPGENVGRYSIIALGKKAVVKLEGKQITITEYDGDTITSEETVELENPLTKIRDYFNSFKVPGYENLPPFSGGALGYLGYETLQYFEDVPVNHGNGDIPDGLMIFPEVLLVYDAAKRSVIIIVSTTPGPQAALNYQDAVDRIDDISGSLAESLPFEEQTVHEKQEEETVHHKMEKAYFLETVEKCKEYIRAGDIIQVVFSQQFVLKTGASPFDLYRTLRVLNPSPYLFYLDFGHFSLIGSSPEVMVRVREREMLLKPIAGTRPRGASISEDNALAGELLEDEKEKAEHLMLVDLGRNDLGRVAVGGSVEVTDYMSIEKYSHVMHIVSTIKGELDEPFDVFDVIGATFPAGTLSGAPKVRAMEIITELEPVKRGPYGGMIFNLGFNGNLDSCITIRTILLSGGEALVQAGAGIVADSVPENEYLETLNKADALINTIKKTKVFAPLFTKSGPPEAPRGTRTHEGEKK